MGTFSPMTRRRQAAAGASMLASFPFLLQTHVIFGKKAISVS